MKYFIPLTVSVILVSCGTQTLSPLSQAPPIVSKEGTLANPVLARDASLALRKIMNGQNKQVIKFVIQKPVGRTGAKAWREMWIFDPQGQKRNFVMTFQEDGQGSANFSIRPM